MYKKITLMLAVSLMSLSVIAGDTLKQDYRELKAATEKKLEIIDAKLEKLGDKISEMSGEAKEELEDQYENLVEMKNDAKEYLADAGDTTEDKWESAKDKMEDYMDTLESKVDEAID